MDPVRGVVELPVGVAVGLLQAVVGSHAQVNRDDVRLHVGKVIAFTGKALRIAVDGEDLAGHIMVTPHGGKGRGVSGRDRPELCVTVWSRRGHRGGDQIMDHSSLVPPALVVYYEQPRDVGEDVDERPHSLWIGGEAKVWFAG